MDHDGNKAATAKLRRSACPHSGGYGPLLARLKDEYRALDEAPIPAEHVDLLLALRHKERDRKRRA